MRHQTLSFVGVLTLFGVLAGCGGSPTSTVKTTKTVKDLKLDGQTGTIGQSNQPANQQAFLQQLMADINAARLKTTTIRCNLTGNYVAMKDGKVGSNKATYCYEKPNKTAVTITQTTESGMSGTKIVWTGGKQLAVHTQLVGFWLNTNLDLHDSRATDQRGYYIDQTSISEMMDTLLDSRNQVKQLQLGSMAGIPVAQLDVIAPKHLEGIAHEIFTIDGQKKVPIAREMYDQNNRLVYSIKMDHMVINSPLPPDTFTVK